MSQSAKGNPAQENLPSPRRGRARPAGDDARPLVATAFSRAGFADSRLVLRWREIAGEDVARLARPLKLREGEKGAVLSLKCDPGAAVFLQHQTRELIGRLNAFLGAGRIARLRLLPGTAPEPREPPAHPSLGRGAPGSPEPFETPTLSLALRRLGALRGANKSAPAPIVPIEPGPTLCHNPLGDAQGSRT